MYLQPEPIVAAPDWRETLTRGDVVLFPFPVADTDNPEAKPKIRPCLVLETPKMGDKRFAVLAYGTSAPRGRHSKGYDICVTAPDATQVAALRKPTRFEGDRRLTVSLDHPGFDLSYDHDTPVIGHLDTYLADRMNDVRARIQAEADIAAETRRERRRQRLADRARWAREGRAFQKHNEALLASRNSDERTSG